ncbi:MAG: protein involved in biosynthesis of mitomycin antibiotics/polyketide fumonisin [Acidobacteria bacterium]|nr:protein involved in biosynthesis of mitomycin antibiotics/polyketide fumonisin [Acidobacteriota bacterium]
MAIASVLSVDPQNISVSVDEMGYAVINKVISQQTISSLIGDLEGLRQSAAIRQKAGQSFGIRDLLNMVPAVRSLAEDDSIKSLVKEVIGPDVKLVRGLLFDKTPKANWKVSWHQDLTIAVRRRREVAGFGQWTIKAGTHHVQPPVGILERMVALRIHLDDADQSNGALKVIPGSHTRGRLTPQQMREILAADEAIVCRVGSGGIMIMRPLLLHSSSSGSQPTHRRVIHLEFAAGMLPGGLEWHHESGH